MVSEICCHVERFNFSLLVFWAVWASQALQRPALVVLTMAEQKVWQERGRSMVKCFRSSYASYTSYISFSLK